MQEQVKLTNVKLEGMLLYLVRFVDYTIFTSQNNLKSLSNLNRMII